MHAVPVVQQDCPRPPHEGVTFTSDGASDAASDGPPVLEELELEEEVELPPELDEVDGAASPASGTAIESGLSELPHAGAPRVIAARAETEMEIHADKRERLMKHLVKARVCCALWSRRAGNLGSNRSQAVGACRYCVMRCASTRANPLG